MFNRRDFLKSSSLLALAPSVPLFLQQTARSAEVECDERILVVIQLSGGNDGLNTIVPFADEGYVKYRKELRLKEDDLHKIADGLGLHPSMRDAADLFEQQRLTIVQGVGYPNPNRSHDVSMATWHTARMDEEAHDGHGWLGRALDHCPTPSRDAPSSVVVGDNSTPVVLQGRRNVSSTFDSLDDLSATSDLRPQISPLSDSDGSELAAYVRRAALDAYATADLLKDLTSQNDGNAITYPSSKLANRLKLISQLIQSDLGTRVYYAMQDGYDTHSTQLGQHSRLLRDLSRGLKAFLDDLAASGLEERVLVLCFSEFGRQVEENASAGTDHGTAGPVLLAGSRLEGGILGGTPSLLDLVDNAPHHTTDFRQVYASILQDWIGVSPLKVMGSAFAPLRLFS